MSNEYEDLRLKTEHMIANATPRLPLCICIDASMSMIINNRMKKINNGIKKMLEDMKNDPYSADTVEVNIVSFGGNEMKVEMPFVLASESHFNDIKPRGETPLGQAVSYSLKVLKARLEEYENVGIEKHKPWLIIISDGAATDDCREAIREIKKEQKNNKLRVFAISMGEKENNLKDFTLDGQVLKLEDFKVDKFFAWISRSMSKQGQSYTAIDETVDIDEWIQ